MDQNSSPDWTRVAVEESRRSVSRKFGADRPCVCPVLLLLAHESYARFNTQRIRRVRAL